MIFKEMIHDGQIVFQQSRDSKPFQDIKSGRIPNALSEKQAKELASKLAKETFKKEKILDAHGNIIRNASFPVESCFANVSGGRWVCGWHPPAGLQASVSFNLDGSEPDVKIYFAPH